MDLCCDIAPFERRYRRPCAHARRARRLFSLSAFCFLWHEPEERRLFLRFERTEGLAIQPVAFLGSPRSAVLKRFILFYFPTAAAIPPPVRYQRHSIHPRKLT